MEDIRLHKVQVDNIKSSYKEHDQLDFSCGFENRAMVCNTLRLHATLKVYKATNTDLDGTEDVYIDPHTGGHTFVASCVTQFQSLGVIESVTEMPRYVKSKTDCENIDNDFCNSDKVCELRSPHKAIQKKLILRKVPKSCGGNATNNCKIANAVASGQISYPSFSIKPRICINNVEGNNLLSYQQSGMVKLTVTLERNLGCLFGQDVTSNYYYELSDVFVTYTSAPDVAKPQPVMMRTTVCLKNSINSAFSNVSSKVPAVCNAMTMSFLPQSHEHQPNFNNLALERPPNISAISYLFNDSSNQFVTFEINNRVEMIKRGLESIDGGASNSSSFDNLSANEGYILGLNWETPVNLSNQKFNIQTNSDISSTNPYIVYLYFHSMRTI